MVTMSRGPTMVAIKERKRLSKLGWRRKSNSASGKSSEGLLLSIGSGIIAFSGGRLRRPHHQHHKKSAYYITIWKVNLFWLSTLSANFTFFKNAILKFASIIKVHKLFLTKEILKENESIFRYFSPLLPMWFGIASCFQKNFKYFCVFFQSNVQ